MVKSTGAITSSITSSNAQSINSSNLLASRAINREVPLQHTLTGIGQNMIQHTTIGLKFILTLTDASSITRDRNTIFYLYF